MFYLLPMAALSAPSLCTSSTVSYQMCLAQFGMRHTPNKHTAPGRAMQDSPLTSHSRKNIVRFIGYSSPLSAALMLLCTLAVHPDQVEFLCLQKNVIEYSAEKCMLPYENSQLFVSFIPNPATSLCHLLFI